MASCQSVLLRFLGWDGEAFIFAMSRPCGKAETVQVELARHSFHPGKGPRQRRGSLVEVEGVFVRAVEPYFPRREVAFRVGNVTGEASRRPRGRRRGEGGHGRLPPSCAHLTHQFLLVQT